MDMKKDARYILAEVNIFFMNPGNKVRLQKFLMGEFSRLALLKDELYYTLGDSCFDLKTCDVALQYHCQHHEADTRIFYHAFVRQREGNNAIVIDAEDTDVICITIQLAQSSLGGLYLYRSGQVFDCSEICSPEMSNVIVPLHAFTGCDCVTGFFGHSEKSIFDKAGEFIDLLANLGRRLNVTKELTENLDKFTIRVIYNVRNSKTLAEARAKKWNSMVKEGTLRLAPDKDSFNQHLNRANYQAHIWLHYNNPRPPVSPLSYGWEMKSDIIKPQNKGRTRDNVPQKIANDPRKYFYRGHHVPQKIPCVST